MSKESREPYDTNEDKFIVFLSLKRFIGVRKKVIIISNTNAGATFAWFSSSRLTVLLFGVFLHTIGHE